MNIIDKTVNLMNHDELIEEFIKVTEALTDVVDGNQPHDIEYFTGLSDKRCKEIYDIAIKYI